MLTLLWMLAVGCGDRGCPIGARRIEIANEHGAIRVCETSDGTKTGLFLRMAPDGRVGERGFLDARGRQDGPWRTYHPNGRIHTEMIWRDGLRDGAWRRYDDRGGTLEAGAWVADRREGEHLTWDAHGALIERNHWRAGELVGEQRRYHPTGTLAEVWSTWRGRREGESRRFDEAGAMVEQSAWMNDLRHGPQLRYHPNGAVAERQVYERGQPQGVIERFDADGHPLASRTAHEIVPYAGPLGPEPASDGGWTLKVEGPAGAPVLNGALLLWPTGARVLVVDLEQGLVHREVVLPEPVGAAPGEAWRRGARFTLLSGATAEIDVLSWWLTPESAAEAPPGAPSEGPWELDTPLGRVRATREGELRRLGPDPAP